MKYKNLSFFSMVFLALALMALILVTQLFTNQSTFTLKKSNLQAVETFKINNRIQRIANLSFDLQSKLSNPNLPVDDFRRIQLTDSLTMLGYNTSILMNEFGKNEYTKNIDELVVAQLNHSLHILVTYQSNNPSTRAALSDSLKLLQFGDKIYTNCLEIQKSLEKNLQQALITNSELAGKLSTYNRLLAMIAIIAIVIMATIIIKRQLQQSLLIEELKQAEMAALKSKTAKEDFLANMSHELRTPLNSLIGFGNLLRQTKLDEKQKEYVGIISSSGYNLLNIVNDVLDLSKIEAGKLKIKNEPFNLKEVFKNLELMFSTSINDKNLFYEWHVDEKIPKILKGDAERLKQILVNLIGNAIKFTNKGGIKINAALVWVEDTKNNYKLGFTVKDTGVGIPKDKIQTVFERFEQLEHVTTRQHGGTGLGLTIVKNLVENLGGSMSVFSQEGEGSEFNFTCLFEKIDAQQTPQQIDSLGKIPQFEPYSILAVDDNKSNQLLLKHLIEKYKASLTIAENGLEAIELMEKNFYDLVLMDIQMPQMDGYTAIKKIRKEKKLLPPIIAMTAYVSEAVVKSCEEAGFDDYLSKPIEENLLIKKISNFLNPVFVNKESSNKLDYLRSLVGDDDDIIREILVEMKAQWKQDAEDLKLAVEINDNEEVKRILHRLKSTFAPLGPESEIYQLVLHESADLTKEDPIAISAYNKFVSAIDSKACEIG